MVPCPSLLKRLKKRFFKQTFGNFKYISLGISNKGHGPMPGGSSAFKNKNFKVHFWKFQTHFTCYIYYRLWPHAWHVLSVLKRDFLSKLLEISNTFHLVFQVKAMALCLARLERLGRL